MQVQADVDQSDISRVATGRRPGSRWTRYPEQTFVGTISQIRLNATQNQNVITYPVIIDVPNPDGKLKPKMTADVTAEVAKVSDVLRVPNAALRFKPIEVGRAGDNDPASRTALEGTAARGAAGAGRALAGGMRAARRQQTVYVLAADGQLKPSTSRSISDGRFTAITEGEPNVRTRSRSGSRPRRSTSRARSRGDGRPGPRRGGGGRRLIESATSSRSLAGRSRDSSPGRRVAVDFEG
jgi:HlyD family secretion protein